jgi:PQQ-dependent catabolism-associated CXXCW motif protein
MRGLGVPLLARRALLLTLLMPGAAAASPHEPSGYRMEQYRAPTPATLAGALVLDTPAAEQLWREGGAVFVDVLPRDARPANLPAGTVWRDRRREAIPGGAWLPNVGYGALSEEMNRYFQRSLLELTAGERTRPLVFYCQVDCWMSWNAAKRALTLGYTRVAWYPEGTDGWAAAGLPLEEAQPRL